VGGSVHGTLRTYDNSFGDPDPHHGLGPGLSFDAVQSHHTVAQGIHLGWHLYDEDHNNGQAYTRLQVVQVHYYVEREWDGGAAGFGIGLDEVFQANYSIDGAYSYSNRDTMIGVNAQLALDVLTLRDDSRLGVLVGVGVFPLIDVLPLLTGGDADVGWRGITASLGVFWQPR
jgi:hypothetical protein